MGAPFAFLAPHAGKIAIAGLGGLFNLLSGRRESKQHERALAHDERKGQMLMQAMREWMAQDERNRQAHAANRAAAMQALQASNLVPGLTPELAAAVGAITPTSAAPMQMPGGGLDAWRGTPVPSPTGMDRFDLFSILNNIFGPEPDQLPTRDDVPPPSRRTREATREPARGTVQEMPGYTRRSRGIPA